VTLKDGKKHEYHFGNDAKDGVYAKVSGSDFIFIAAHDVTKALEGELRARDLFQFQPANVKELRMTGWKAVYKFSLTLDLARQPDKTWKVKTGPKDLKLDQDKVNGLLEAMTDPSRPLVERFVPGGAKPEYKLGKDDRLLEIEFVLDDGKTATLTVGALDAKANAYYAQSSVAPKEVFLVPKAHLEQLAAGAEYFSKK
jgi:hypothetical protein